MHIRNLSLLVLSLALVLGACSDDKPGGNTTGGNPAGNGAEGFEGSLVTSGGYVATWTVNKEAEADVFNSSSFISLTSDKQTFGSIRVQQDGSVSFGGAELGANITFEGSGAQVTMDKTDRFVCAFSVDTDLKGTRDGAILHMKGSMKVNWHPQGIGDASCP